MILGGHGITAWGDDQRRVRAQLAGDHHGRGRAYIAEHGRPDPFGPTVPGLDALPEDAAPGTGRRTRPGDPRPRLHRPAAGRPLHRHRRGARLPGPRREHPRAGRAGHLVPGPLPAHEGPPDGPRPAAERAARRDGRPAQGAARAVPRGLRRLLRAVRRRRDSPPMRGADPAIVLVPGVGMFSFGANKQTARVAGEFYVNAINVMRGAEAISTYAPIDESEKFRIEYWALEEAKLARMPKPKPLATRVALRHRRRLRHRPGHRAPAGGRGRLRGRRRPRRRRGRAVAAEIGGTDVAVAVTADVTDADGRRGRVARGRARLRRRRPRRQQRRACRSPSRCWRPPRPTGTCSTT